LIILFIKAVETPDENAQKKENDRERLKTMVPGVPVYVYTPSFTLILKYTLTPHLPFSLPLCMYIENIKR